MKKKAIKITESDLTRMVQKIVNENKPVKTKSKFRTNLTEGYKKFGCNFLENRKSLNEDKLKASIKTKGNINEQKNLKTKITFIKSMIESTNCGKMLREQSENTPPVDSNRMRKVRKKIYENLNWESIRKNNSKRLLENRRKGKTL
tara:strand:- start:11666 stop:12103 length:438 start_codon:yes stop_codon:yes gene_type:complete